MLFRGISESSVLLRPRFRRFHDLSWKKKHRVSFGSSVLVFLPPALCAGWERLPPPLCNVRAHVQNCLPPLACVHFRNLHLPLLRPFNAIIVCFAVISRHACSSPVVVIAVRGYQQCSLLSFFLGEFVRERLVRVLDLERTFLVQFYLVGTSIVSVIASWLPKVPP